MLSFQHKLFVTQFLSLKCFVNLFAYLSLIKSRYLIVENDATSYTIANLMRIYSGNLSFALSKGLIKWFSSHRQNLKLNPYDTYCYKLKAINWWWAHTVVIARLRFRSTKLIIASLADIDYGRSVIDISV